MTRKEKILSVIQPIYEEKGFVLPEDVVSAARKEDSLIHSFFDWDDSSAAEKYRLWQARQLTKEVVIEYEGTSVPAYYNVVVNRTESNSGSQGYVPLERILSEEDLHNQVVAEAIRELRYWQKMYNSLRELEKVINEQELVKIEELIN